MWAEKYRPRRLEEVVGQEEVLHLLQNLCKSASSSSSLPHLLFYGPPGTGKTSTVLALATELFGSDPQQKKHRVLELNASSDRGIETVREKIKTFAQFAVPKNKVEEEGKGGKQQLSYKLIILDEADSMTQDAQNALRRIIEQYSSIARFCVICNYLSHIIDPIVSRCAKFRFGPLPAQIMLSRLDAICRKENVTLLTEHKRELALEHLRKVSRGDLRRAITLLQSASRVGQQNSSSGNVRVVTLAQIDEVAGIIPDNIIHGLINACADAKTDAETLKQMWRDNVYHQAFAPQQVLLQLSEFFAQSSQTPQMQQSQILIRIAQVEKKLLDGADEVLQLFDLAFALALILRPAEKKEIEI